MHGRPAFLATTGICLTELCSSPTSRLVNFTSQFVNVTAELIAHSVSRRGLILYPDSPRRDSNKGGFSLRVTPQGSLIQCHLFQHSKVSGRSW